VARLTTTSRKGPRHMSNQPGEKEWITKARTLLAPSVSEIRRLARIQFPRLSARAVHEIVDDEVSKFVFAVLTRSDKVTSEEEMWALCTDIQQRCITQQEST